MNISVCMATYNGEKYIKKQIESILPQLKEEDELIISDDSSSDSTLSIINSFNDNRIKVYADQKFKNPIFNFEFAINKSKSEVIFLADQDDIWEIDKIATMKEYLIEYDVVVCDCKVINDDMQELHHSYFDYINAKEGFFHNFKRNTYMGNCMAFNRVVLNKALPFPKDIPNHDLWIGMVADIFYTIKLIPKCLSMHRRHHKNASNTFDIKYQISFFQKVMKRVNTIKYIPFLFSR